MNRSNKFSTLLLAAGLSALLVPAFGQTSTSGSATSGASTGTNAVPPVRPGLDPSPGMPPPVRPDIPMGSPNGSGSVTDTPRVQTGVNATGRPGSINSSTDSTIRSSTSGTVSGSTATSGVNSGVQTGVQSNMGFDQYDSDRDGRVSASEYNQSSVSVPARPAPGAIGDSAITSSDVVVNGGRSSATTGVTTRSQTAVNSTEQFRLLDRNHDGYLSRDEIDSAAGNRITRP